MNSDVIGIFNFSLCFAVGKNDLPSATLSVFSHSLCQFVIPYFFSSVAIVIGILLYEFTIFSSPSSSIASLAGLSASTFTSIQLCAFTLPKWIDQFCVVPCFVCLLLKGCV